jgi:broad specificity phosphatase PhoE
LWLQVVKGALPLIRATKGFDPENDSGSNIYIWASITQRAYQTAEVLGSLIGVSRNRIVPEYSFLDPRGLGALEGYT